LKDSRYWILDAGNLPHRRQGWMLDGKDTSFKMPDCGYRMFTRMSRIFHGRRDSHEMQSQEEFGIKIKERANFSNSL
jgi:hypothetical protein